MTKVSVKYLDRAMKGGLCKVLSEQKPNKGQSTKPHKHEWKEVSGNKEESVKAVREQRTCCVCGWYGRK